MAVTMTPNGVVEFTQMVDKWHVDYTGVVSGEQLFFVGAADVLKQAQISTENLPTQTCVIMSVPQSSGQLALVGEGATPSFSTIQTPSGTSPVATAPTDVLTLIAGSNIAITGDASTDSVTVAVTGLTKSSVGLGNVDNTSDVNKPVSTATQTALNGKVNTGVVASTPSRVLGTAFQPSTTKSVLCIYTISISCSATIAGGGQTGSVELRSDSAATPTTVRSQIANTNSVSLAVAVGVVNTQVSVVCHLVPAGDFVRLVSAGTGTISIVNQTEVTVG